MAISPERNDIEISKLFHWFKNFSFDYSGTKIEGYIRLVGDAELNRARVFSLRRSKELRNKLKDLNSDERMAYIADQESMEKENLIEYTIFTKMNDIAQESYKDVTIPFPREVRSDSKLESQEKYQTEVDTYPAKFDAEFRKLVDNRTNKERERLNSLSLDALYKEYVTNTTNYLCDLEVNRKFKEMSVFLGLYKDDTLTEPMFENYEDFENLSPDLKELFISEYEGLEIGVEELKKSQGVMR